MRRLVSLLAIVLAGAALLPGAAKADFGLHGFDVTFEDQDGSMAKAGSHPFAVTTSFFANVDGEGTPEGWLRDVFLEQVPGLVGDTTAYDHCTTVEFLQIGTTGNACPVHSAVGITAVEVNDPGKWASVPVYNLAPPPGVLLRLGFTVVQANIAIDVELAKEPPYNAVAASRNTSRLVEFLGSRTVLWGDPSDPAHNSLRGSCGQGEAVVAPGEEFEFEGSGACPVPPKPKPFLTLPTTCAEPLTSRYRAFSWEGDSDSDSVRTHDAAGNPSPFRGCETLAAFTPEIEAQPTSRAAESPTGLDFTLDAEDPGLTSLGPPGDTHYETRSQSRIRKAVVTLPEGMTANPSLAEGLEVCSEGDLDNETLGSAPGAGCPEASKIGSIEVVSPLVSESVKGALYQAEPHANLADDSLIAFYIVLKNPKLGIIVKQAVKVQPNPTTGQLVAITDEIPQLPFSAFRLKFREGGRSPLVSPPTCGRYEVQAQLTPWSGGPPTVSTSSFEIVSGPNGGPCPSGGVQPFAPGFEAGTLNNAAGRFSPFAMRLLRRDGDQDLVRFDATLPRGVLAKLAGVSKCPDRRIAQAKARTGRAELASPSCPANSRIGRVLSGAGVGSQLTYVPGTIYLAGPFGGAPLSVVGIVPAVAGPFDVGTVVVRQALRLDPVTGEVTADGALSDPLPHILAGIPLRVREIQVHVDRSGFTLNPTSCDPMATRAAIWGGGGNPFSLLDDAPVARSARFQAADCASLGFRPRLGLRLRGGTGRGAHPALLAVLRPRPNQANVERSVVRLPRSAFLDQGHIRTICTRVQFAADNCPKGAIYGRVVAFSPLLDEPLRGPAYLRSSDNELPDLVFDLHGVVDIESSARVDSIKGGIRVTFAAIPDAPLSRVVVRMQGGKKGLIVNSRNLCAGKGKNRANVRLDAHSGKRVKLRPVLRPQCKKKRAAKRSTHRPSAE